MIKYTYKPVNYVTQTEARSRLTNYLSVSGVRRIQEDEVRYSRAKKQRALVGVLAVILLGIGLFFVIF